MRPLAWAGALSAALIICAALAACGSATQGGGTAAAEGPAPAQALAGAAATTAPGSTAPAKSAPAKTSPPAAHTAPAAVPAGPAAGNPAGTFPVPAAAQAVSTAHPTRVIGTGTPASCTSQAVVAAVAAGGIITFSCGPGPVTITMTATAKVVNTSQQVVLDGGGKVTLSGGGRLRILYQNTCDQAQRWTTSHCQDQPTPALTVQNLTFIDGNATGSDITGGSGGAIYAEGGALKVVNSRFINNRCYPMGPDLGGAAIRAFEQDPVVPVYIVHSTFTGGQCSNGGALSSIGVSWTVIDSLLTGNHAIGVGANPASAGSPGGGSGGAIYNDGDTYTLTVEGSVISGNTAREGGGAIFYVSNDHTGTLHIENSILRDNPSAAFHNFPGTIFYLGHGNPIVTGSVLS
ncbi:MAG TPA: hypothetical protein VIZ00_00295 [Streptosporangiaceae bacterium]